MSVRTGNGALASALNSAANFCRSGMIATICPVFSRSPAARRQRVDADAAERTPMAAMKRHRDRRFFQQRFQTRRGGRHRRATEMAASARRRLARSVRRHLAYRCAMSRSTAWANAGDAMRPASDSASQALVERAFHIAEPVEGFAQMFRRCAWSTWRPAPNKTDNGDIAHCNIEIDFSVRQRNFRFDMCSIVACYGSASQVHRLGAARIVTSFRKHSQ